jgi:hypothetical protein
MGTVFFQKRGMSSVIWNPETSSALAEFGKVGRFETNDPQTIKKLRELGYPEQPPAQPAVRYAQSAEAPQPAQPSMEEYQTARNIGMDDEVPLDDPEPAQEPAEAPEEPPVQPIKSRSLVTKRTRKVK